MKKCTKCNELKTIDSFYKRGNKHRNECKCCIIKITTLNKSKICPVITIYKNRKTAKDWYNRNKERANISGKKWVENNKEQHVASCKKWNENNREYRLKKGSEHYQNNKASYRARDAKRRAVELNAILSPKLFNEELKEIYNNCPKGMHVDHIVPLQGKTVCGLHVPWNLQYLSPEENIKKGNKLI